MNCTHNEVRTDTEAQVAGVTCKITLLVISGFVLISVNILLAVRLRRQHRQLCPYNFVLRGQCLWAVMLVLSTVPLHVLLFAAGPDALSEVTCSACGTLLQILLGTWTSLQAIQLFERYMKVIKPSEHIALFSKVNIKLMLWGTVLLHGMLSLGPIYGWGQYTHARDRLRFWLLPMTNSPSHDNYTEPLSMESQAEFINSTIIKDQITDNMLTALFPTDFIPQTEFYAFPSAMYIDLIGGSINTMDCLNTEYTSGRLSNRIYQFFQENSLGFREQFDIDTVRLEVEIDDSFLQDIKAKDRSYYDNTICEVNYQVRSGDDSFYILMTCLLQLLVPMGLIIFFSVRIVYNLWISQQRLQTALTNTEYNKTLESLFGSALLIVLILPYFGCNLAARSTHTLSSSVHFTVRFLLYLSTGGPPFIHAIINRHHIYDFFQSLCVDCCGCSLKTFQESSPQKCQADEENHFKEYDSKSIEEGSAQPFSTLETQCTKI